MNEVIIHRHMSILEILVAIGEASNKSEAKMMVRSSSPIFVDDEKVTDENWVIDFVQKHKKNRMYDRHRKSAILKYYSLMRVGGSINPNEFEEGSKYILIRSGALKGKVELYK